MVQYLEDVMKTYQAIAVGLALLAATTAQAQNPASLAKTGNSSRLEQYAHLDFDKIEKTYLNCLNSDNQGVVEAAIGMVTYIRVAFPNRKMTEIREKLFDLASSGVSHSVRSKAFVAMQVFADPMAYGKLLDSNGTDGTWNFDDIASKFRP
jgi:hypothetical protein